LPSIGTLRHMDTPGAVSFELGGTPGGVPASVRIDSGVREGDAISPFYDPMIAKLIVWGADRAQALARMSQALAEFQITGLATNIAFLKRLVEGSAFASADLDTGLIERHGATLFPPAQAAPIGALALAAMALAGGEHTGSSDPWANATGWRLNGDYKRQLAFSDEHQSYAVALTYQASGWHIAVGDAEADLALAARDGATLSIRLGATAMHGTVRRDGELFHVFTGGQHFTLAYHDPMAHAGELETAGGRLTAPMPGKVVAILASAGQEVKQGEALVIMEAMKMEHTIGAPSDGVVEELLYAVGDQVADGAPLLAFRAA
jgi:3-methylcrotonyl-CoA carboxylase alpha subunit